ncbi:TPA: type II toxin-antitoxin system RelE/ParE family toxin [Flavobacterium psychrophilum]|uniref:type II toxin-antitoxin system RelE/ParE family toxin n=1 Tax=Flavobacterium psychrophilum TaxID=96345 RepID=UPI000B7C2771|nr:type II toxin-antitoxin system RelE/ParE family toxin [Flavobacterium psychrophilum]SNB03146.1 putative plasmid stabilization system protein [Flavobacterium psychrophilum]
MSYKVIWSNFAENELDKIFEYYIEQASLKVAKKIIKNILAEPKRLINNSEMFQTEELLIDREEIYRYIVCDDYKIIYSVDIKLKLIKIADVFDTRQNPIKIKRNK